MEITEQEKYSESKPQWMGLIIDLTELKKKLVNRYSKEENVQNEIERNMRRNYKTESKRHRKRVKKRKKNYMKIKGKESEIQKLFKEIMAKYFPK